MKYPNQLILFFQSLFNQRYVLKTLVIRDFKSRYMATYLGLPWAFIQPAIYVVVIWFAFTYGLRGGGREVGVPFVPWLLAGIVPWMFMSHTMFSSCNSLIEYSYLIKKTKFNVSFIPLVKIFSGMIVHLILMVIVILLMVFQFDIHPTIYWIQWFYYLFSAMILLAGISWFVASVAVFVKDIVHVVNIVVTIFFWATPIIWPYTMISDSNLRFIALLNPFFYITEGYRYTFIEQRWFFEFVEMNVFFWVVSSIIFVLGLYTFFRLRPGFGDEL